jgi:hypothetical protein
VENRLAQDRSGIQYLASLCALAGIFLLALLLA